MSKTHIPLQVNVKYGTNGSIELTSTDEKLRGRPFKIQLKNSSKSYKILNQLLVSNGIENLTTIDFPEKSEMRVTDLSNLDVPEQDPRYTIRIGMAGKNETIDLNLLEHPNVFINGITGSGKSILQQNIILHALNHDDINVLHIDPTGINEYKNLDSKKYEYASSNSSAINTLLNNAVSVMYDRFRLLQDLGKNRYTMVETQHINSIFIVIDEPAAILHENRMKYLNNEENYFARNIKRNIDEIARLGNAVGLYLFISSQVPILPSSALMNFNNRIICGNSPYSVSKALFNEPSEFGSYCFNVRGRAVIKTAGEKQKLFQAYFVPYDEVKKYH